jgi:hypothetical protein
MSDPVLHGVLPVVAASRDVTTDLDRLAEHAGWMAYEAGAAHKHWSESALPPKIRRTFGG